MKLRITAIALSIVCLISLFSIACFAAETQAPDAQIPSESVMATVAVESTTADSHALTEDPTYNSPPRGIVTEAAVELVSETSETNQTAEAKAEPEGPNNGKAFIIGLCCIFVGGLIACGIIYYKRKNDDSCDDE